MDRPKFGYIIMGKDLNGRELGTNLYQRKDGRYEAKYTDNFGKRHSIYGAKLLEVKKKLNEALYNKEHSIMCENAEFTLNEWFDIWLEIYYKNTVKIKTYIDRKNAYDCCIRKSFLGSMFIKNIRPVHIQKFINELTEERNLAFAGIRPYKDCLNCCLKKAYLLEYIQKNPVEFVTLPKKQHKINEAFTLREQELFLNYSSKSYYYNLFRFLLLTGTRIGEALALTWNDLDLENDTITINKTVGRIRAKDKEIYLKSGGKIADCNELISISSPKTEGSARVIPINKQCLDLLKEMREKESLNEEFNGIVFHSQRNGYLRTENIDAAIKVICNKINTESGESIKQASAHTFRHTYATRLFENNVSPKTVQHLLGHYDLNITMDIYTHITKEKIKEEVKNMDFLNVNESSSNCRQKDN